LAPPAPPTFPLRDIFIDNGKNYDVSHSLLGGGDVGVGERRGVSLDLGKDQEKAVGRGGCSNLLFLLHCSSVREIRFGGDSTSEAS